MCINSSPLPFKTPSVLNSGRLRKGNGDVVIKCLHDNDQFCPHVSIRKSDISPKRNMKEKEKNGTFNAQNGEQQVLPVLF